MTSQEKWNAANYDKVLTASRAWKARNRERMNDYNRQVRLRESPVHAARIRDWCCLFESMNDTEQCVASHVLLCLANAGDEVAVKVTRDPYFDYNYLAYHIERP